MTDDLVSMNEVSGRFAYLLSEKLGNVPVVGGLGAAPYELVLGNRTVLVSASDEFMLPADVRTGARRLVANAEFPTLCLTLHRPWDAVWSADTAVHVAHREPGSLLASEILAARFAFLDNEVWLVAEDFSRGLRIDPHGWSPLAAPKRDAAFDSACAVARAAWQSAVADPARIL